MYIQSLISGLPMIFLEIFFIHYFTILVAIINPNLHNIKMLRYYKKENVILIILKSRSNMQQLLSMSIISHVINTLQAKGQLQRTIQLKDLLC